MRGQKGILYNLSILSAGQIVSQLANMAALIYLADYLGAHWFGVIQVGVAFMSYALITAEWGMMSLGIREVSRLDEPKDIFAYASQHTGLLAMQAGFVLLAGLIILPRLPFYEHSPLIFILYLVTVIPQIYTQNWVAVGLERMAWVGASRIVRSLTYAILVLFVLRHLGGNQGQSTAHWVPAIFLIAMIISNLVVNIPLARWFGRFVHPQFPPRSEAWRRWKETGSIGANILVLRLLFNIDIILLGILAAPAVAGNYAAASRIMFLLVVAVEVLWAALLPRLSRLAKDSREDFLRSFNLYFGLVSVALLPMALGGYLLGNDFVGFIYKGKFPDAGPVFQVLAVSYSMLALGTFLGNTLLADDRQKWYFLPLIASSLTAVTGVMLLVPGHLGLGASWAMAGSHGLLLIVLLIINARKFNTALGVVLISLVPALAAMAMVVSVLPELHVLLRMVVAVTVYSVLAAWPVSKFRKGTRALGQG